MLPGTARPGAWDRGRVGERLRAALAGLQELQVLRERQRALVRGALAMQHPPAAPSKEQRLEATLSALKEQLSRLRRQDVGLKSHLDQLDQQISELKLDVSKTSSEYLDSDSRPSSGFYDLSDGGSCSLSNSCTSVYSESISSSHTSLLPGAQQPKTRLSVFDYRPKSADETTVHTTKFQQQGVCISNGCRMKASTVISGTPTRSRPRPVSTGDLEWLVSADTAFQKATDPKSMPPVCRGGEHQFHNVDPKYQNDLISRNGNDVYPYPSPLHAVALQSPLFSLVGVPLETDNHAPPSKSTPAVTGPSLIRTRPVIETRPGGYINKLLQLTRCRGNNQAAASERVSTKSQPSTMHQRLIITPSAGGVKINSSNSQLEKQLSSLESNKAEGKLQREVPEGECAKQQETVQCVNAEQASTMPDTEPSAVNSCYSAKSTARSSPLTDAKENSPEHSSSKSHRVRVRFANSKMKSVKIKRRNSEKLLRPGKLSYCTEKPKAVHLAARFPAECHQPQRQPGAKGLLRRPTYAGEVTGRSCSESSLFPVQFRMPPVPSRPDLHRASSNALYSLETTYVDTAIKKKQRKWQSTVEISAKAHIASGFGFGPPRQPIRRAGVLRAVSVRARSKPHHHEMYAKSESDHSEYSAECASLFHSTIAETSEGEVSDYTANRFGDSESSESDSDGSSHSSSFTLDYDDGDDSELIWPETSVQQSAAVQTSSKPLPPMPKICRIKASKALKKKIRRFQPASLKVMTMV
uniref:Dishevelled binding antagonist of beta catenin 2 n=1 Tax=Crocodylus porosus TaxID=8502 RepID=A0A7M4FHH0_CROPO